MEINPPYPPKPYPIDVFTGKARRALQFIVREHQVSEAVAAMCLLYAFTLASQGKYDVKTPKGSIKPLSLYFMLIALSGDGKSPVDRVLLDVFRQFDRAQHDQYRKDLQRYKAALRVWETTLESLDKQLGASKPGSEAWQRISAEILKFTMLEPIKPRKRTVLHSALTEAAFFKELGDDNDFIGISHDEGERGFAAMTEQSWLWNQLHDGKADPVSKAVIECNRVTGVRFSAFVMAQPIIFAETIKASYSKLRGSGLLARFFIVCPETLRGTREVYLEEGHSEDLDFILKRLQNLLKASAEARKTGRDVLEFEWHAKWRWKEIAKTLEHSLLPGGCFQSVGDFESKAIDVICRLAAVLHCIDHDGGTISRETVERAITLVWYHLEEAVRIFAEPSPIAQRVNDVFTLECIIGEHHRSAPAVLIPLTDLRDECAELSKARFDAAYFSILRAKKIELVIGLSKKRMVKPNPAYFGVVPTQQVTCPSKQVDTSV